MRTALGRMGYALYAAGRAWVRTVGLAPWARRVIGARAGRWVSQLSSHGGRPVQVQGHRMVLSPPGEYAAPDLVADRYEPGTTRLFRELLEPGQTVIDIGAHAGYYTLLAARAVGATGRVIAFEPAPRNLALLRQNVAQNGYAEIVTVVPSAVSNAVGRQTLLLSGFDTGFHSLQQVGPRRKGADGGVVVETTTVDAYLVGLGWPRVDLVKLDIEGGETAALRGMRGLTARTPGLRLVVEFCPWILRALSMDPAAFLQLLRDEGFDLQVIEEARCTPLSELDKDGLIRGLLAREGYVNLLGTRRVEAAMAVPGAHRHLGASP